MEQNLILEGWRLKAPTQKFELSLYLGAGGLTIIYTRAQNKVYAWYHPYYGLVWQPHGCLYNQC